MGSIKNTSGNSRVEGADGILIPTLSSEPYDNPVVLLSSTFPTESFPKEFDDRKVHLAVLR